MWSCEAPAGAIEDGSDCHDDDPAAFPGAHSTEVPGDGIDQDCDGLDACTDLSCDGWADIVFAQTDDEGSYAIDSVVYLGGPDGYSADRRIDLPTVGAARSRVADLNADGLSDIVFASGVLDDLGLAESVVYWGSSEGFSETSRTSLPSSFAEALAVADLNADGQLDVLLGTWLCITDCDVASLIYWGDDLTKTTQLDINGAVDVQVGDVDLDGVVDLVVANGAVDFSGAFAAEFWIYRGAGDGTFSLSDPLPATAASSAGIADLNEDGWPDVVFASHYAPEDGGAQVSQIYWGSSEGFDAERLTELPTTHAAGMIIVGP